MWIKLGFKKKIVGAAYIQVRSIDRKLRYCVASVKKFYDNDVKALLYSCNGDGALLPVQA